MPAFTGAGRSYILLFSTLVHAVLQAFPKWCKARAHRTHRARLCEGVHRKGAFVVRNARVLHLGANAQGVPGRGWYNGITTVFLLQRATASTNRPDPSSFTTFTRIFHPHFSTVLFNRTWEGFSWQTFRLFSRTFSYPPSPMWRAN
ncbi:hypothetical protein [Paracidovorax sp. MALMAid1276]|uniref:hypothetical protein n=1 Tax=Paracidovorax sp. MALMAid1276 TaxID=3411631 RepID=UPI003B9A76AA